MFFKIVLIWLLLFTSFMAFRLSCLEADTLNAYGLAIGAIANLVMVFVSLKDIGGDSSDEGNPDEY